MNIKHKSTMTMAVTIFQLTMAPITFCLNIAHSQDEEPLSVLLIHGWNNDATVWNGWIYELNNTGIYAEAVTFGEDDPEYDACGSSADHAADLNQIIEDFKSRTHAEKINLVAHSKGGLDARVFLSNSFANEDVANLIMLGTPNRGSPVADHFVGQGIIVCDPAVYDLLTDSNATKVPAYPNTNYHTIASDWVSEYEFLAPFLTYDTNCPASTVVFQKWVRDQLIDGPDDGLVPLRSADPGGQIFNSLGHTNNCHTNLFTHEELDKALSILKP
ncbi:MAG: esterase/lipase family protein [Nitrososphaeraceae archaeon]